MMRGGSSSVWWGVMGVDDVAAASEGAGAGWQGCMATSLVFVPVSVSHMALWTRGAADVQQATDKELPDHRSIISRRRRKHTHAATTTSCSLRADALPVIIRVPPSHACRSSPEESHDSRRQARGLQPYSRVRDSCAVRRSAISKCSLCWPWPCQTSQSCLM